MLRSGKPLRSQMASRRAPTCVWSVARGKARSCGRSRLALRSSTRPQGALCSLQSVSLLSPLLHLLLFLLLPLGLRAPGLVLRRPWLLRCVRLLPPRLVLRLRLPFHPQLGTLCCSLLGTRLCESFRLEARRCRSHTNSSLPLRSVLMRAARSSRTRPSARTVALLTMVVKPLALSCFARSGRFSRNSS